MFARFDPTLFMPQVKKHPFKITLQFRLGFITLYFSTLKLSSGDICHFLFFVLRGNFSFVIAMFQRGLLQVLQEICWYIFFLFHPGVYTAVKTINYFTYSIKTSPNSQKSSLCMRMRLADLKQTISENITKWKVRLKMQVC